MVLASVLKSVSFSLLDLEEKKKSISPRAEKWAYN